MRVFSVAGIEGREFSDRLLRVSELKEWAARRGAEMPLSSELQGLTGYDFVNVAALLSAIGDAWLGDLGAALKAEAAKAEREASSKGAEAQREARAKVIEAEREAHQMVAEAEREARAIVAAHPHLAADPAAEIAPRWLAADHAREEWRAVILAGVQAGALVFLDPASKLPLRSVVERITPQRRLTGEVQDEAILKAIRTMGLDPQALPQTTSGRAGHKSAVRDVFFKKAPRGVERQPVRGGPFVSESAFEKAWERLRARGDISDAKPTP